MVSPGINVRLFDLSVYVPQVSNAIMGCVGPATKGPVNVLTEVTDEGNFVNLFGRPVDGHYAPRAAIRYFKAGNQLKFNRIAGRNLKTASLTLFDATGKKPVLIITGISPGTWANSDVTIAVTQNGTPATSYNIFVYFLGQLVEPYLVLTNGIVVSKINNTSSRIQIALAPGAGATLPGTTVDPVTGALKQLSLSGGDDGAFATTDSAFASLGGFVGKRFYGKMDTLAGSRVWQNLVAAIPAANASKPIYYGTVGMPVVPGTFTVRVQTAAGPTYIELSDSGSEGYALGGSGLGYLAPVSGPHVGFVDYRTGNFGVQLSGGPTLFLNGTIDGIWIRANSESVGASAQGVGAYAGNVSSAPNALGFNTSNKTIITVPIAEQVGVQATGGATSSNAVAALKNLAGWIVPGTVVLTPSHPTLSFPNPVYDDGFGGFRTAPNGGGTALVGAINYRTGVWSVNWDPTGPAAPNGMILQAAYDAMLFDMGGGVVPGPTGVYVSGEVDQPNAPAGATLTSADVGAQTIRGPIFPNTVKLTISATSGGPFTAYDDGVGGWLTLPRGYPLAAAVTGTINYQTGAWSITPPAPFTPVTAGAIVTTSYVSQVEDKARRTLRGTGDEALQAGGFLGGGTGGLSFAPPSSSNAVPFNSDSFFDHTTGQFAFKLNLTPLGAGTQSFDVKNSGTLTSVYMPVEEILGFGDGVNVIFKGQLDAPPYRREPNRLMGFQSAQDSQPGAGDPLVTFAALGPTDTADYWIENVALSTDPNNSLSFRTGVASIKWTGAPQLLEAVYVVAEDTILHVTAKYPGDIGNERVPLTTGFYVTLGQDPSLAGTLLFQTWFNGVVQESFGQSHSLQEVINKVNDPLNGSLLVSVTGTPSGINGTVVADVATATQNAGLSGAFTIADVIGAKIGQTYTGLQMFLNDEVVAVNWIMIPGQWHRQVILALQQLCEHKGRFAMGIVPAPDLDDPFKHRDFFDGNYNSLGPGGPAVATVVVPYPPLNAIDSSQLATIVPWVQYLDQYSNEEVFEPADGDMAKLIAVTPAPWYPVAGLRRGKVIADDVRYSASRDDRDLIYGVVGSITEVVNPIIRKQGRGLVLYGQRTCQRNPSKTDRINVRWTVNVIMNILDLVSQEFLFEINDPILWREAQQALNDALQPIVERRGLTDALVVLDGTTTTATDIDNLTMHGKIFIKPAGATEFIDYDVILTPEGVNFADVILPG